MTRLVYSKPEPSGACTLTIRLPRSSGGVSSRRELREDEAAEHEHAGEHREDERLGVHRRFERRAIGRAQAVQRAIDEARRAACSSSPA